ncbi:flagellin [Aquibacillus salsiterrae]|uniref:Flagellin n=1 Tax=Aquibacillus salsiterrae TaxID=2950439 RepID=A0A9X3WF17_9BACI|nr:flagellin [Aquibacillus salsiterrae]MDC3418617.1 hypothetical protein [Aquibacillus salsiterrae]
MIINHNVTALNTFNKLNRNSNNTTSTMEKLSSGLRINKAKDDSAGLAISEKMRAQIRGLQQAQSNIQDGISLIQIAEAGLGNIQNSNLQRLRELAVQSANDTLTDDDRKQIQQEVMQIKNGINEIANNTEFNGIKLLNRDNGDSISTTTTEINTSPDVTAWNQYSTGDTQTPNGFAWNGNQYVTVGTNGSIQTSNDGKTWTSQISGTNSHLEDVEWNGSQFVAVGTGGAILTSSDGVNWNPESSGNNTENIYGIEWNGSSYVAVGSNGTILTSNDGSSWSTESSGTTDHLYDVKWNGSQFIAVGDNGNILSSTNGTSWTSETSGTSSSLFEVTWNGSQYAAVGSNGAILTSSDGSSWSSQNSGLSSTEGLLSIDYGNDNYVAVGTNGNIITSSDGVSWTIQDSGYSNTLNDVFWNGSQFTAGGNMGAVLVSGEKTTSTTTTTTNLKEQPLLYLQVGANSGDSFQVNLTNVTTIGLGIANIDLTNRQDAESAISKIDEALKKVSSERGKFGAYQNALEHIHNNSSNYEINLTASESRIRDADLAKQMMKFTKEQILSQASQAMLTQASQQPQQALQLLK